MIVAIRGKRCGHGKWYGLIAGLALVLSIRDARAQPMLGQFSPTSGASASVIVGEMVYRRNCATCHSTERGRPGNLRGVFNAGAGQRPGTYATQSLKYSGKIWNTAQLDEFLADPPRLVPGTTMLSKLSNPDDRRNVIAYLMTLQ